MTAQPYRALTWIPHEVISEDKQNTEANNIQWLFENTPRALYTIPRLKRVEGVKIACGKVPFSRSKSDRAYSDVAFPNFFSISCQPVITLGVISDAQRKIWAVHSGIGGLQPTHNGFRISIEVGAAAKKKDEILRRFWVSWIAMGY